MIERVLSFSLKHRYLVVMVILLLSVLGLWSLQKLPIDAVPDITNNQIQINTTLSGLSPEDMEKQVTFPIENALAGIAGLESTRSLTRNGFSQVTVIFDDKVDIYFARNQVTERLSEIQEQLPAGATPRMGAISTGLGEVYMWAVKYQHPGGQGAKIKDGEAGWQSDGSYLTPEGESLRTEVAQLAYLRTVQDWMIRPQLKNVAGVAGVDVIGGFEKQYHIQPDPLKLRTYGLSLSQLAEAVEKANQSRGAGVIEQQGEAYLVRLDGRLKTSVEIAATVVATRQGIPVYVRDVATVTIGEELRTGSASENGHEVVVGTALMRIGENSRTVALAVDQKLIDVRRSLPPDIEAQSVLDRSKLVNATIETVVKNLSEGALLVVFVLFVLLGNIRAALITAIVIPLTVLLMSIGMFKAQISGNLMSLGALDFGLIVDGAVIIVENCLQRLAARQQHLGRSLTLSERLSEVLHASREMIQPSVFGQAIIITVYLPILALEGVEGKMFHPMAATVMIALVTALILSLTLVPALVAIFCKNTLEHESVLITRSRQGYAPLLDKALNSPKTVLTLAAVAFGVALLVFTRLGQEFIPTLDEKDIAMQAIRIPSTGIQQSTRMQLAIEKSISTLPEVAFIFSKTGTAEMAADPMPPSISDTFIMFKPRAQWPDPGLSKAELSERIEKHVSTLLGNNYEFTQPIQMRFNELLSGVRGDVAIKVFGDDFEALQQTANRIASTLKRVDGASEVKVEQVEGQALLDIAFNREQLARYGLPLSDVQDMVAAAIGGREAGQVFEGDRHFAIVVRLPEELRADLERLRALPIPVMSDGNQAFVTLGELATLEIKAGLNQISRENGKRRIVIQSNVRNRDLGSFIADAQQAVTQEVKLPAGYWLGWGGQFENLQQAKERLSMVIPLCLALIFLLLFSALNNVRQAVLVFSAIPLGLTGGILALWLRDMPFSITAAVGFIALSGVVVLNGLVMVSRINHLHESGMALQMAIREGSLSRLRPVLMTALVASLGFLPMALATGTGAEVQKPLATVVIGGLITSTLLTLVLLPALYRLFERDNEESQD
ncbi:efflux RND transporter permease subunit [Agitococcus lubricus]|uniref:Cobalt-zinc-cadmium resistance protein CzcA n=1 Tax=Agitococcus lubricus TaxID=1077255 RepID=A0A2T5ITG1_9GAMM|nr:CusA/CzcA family heavy metal efflux RND transporter [Agitococcus lubricus]PTQ87159.1 cobalt-zinc-cadmium resistance protein CzcA [Agitococcus lubricus]